MGIEDVALPGRQGDPDVVLVGGAVDGARPRTADGDGVDRVDVIGDVVDARRERVAAGVRAVPTDVEIVCAGGAGDELDA
jgi:hypothetical protein